MGFILFVVYVLSWISIFSPETGWYLSIGWQFKNAELSETALKAQQGISILVVIVLSLMGIANMGTLFSKP